MALKDLKSMLGPTNAIGTPGTGEVNDPFGNFEGGSALEAPKSRYATAEANGSKPTGPDTGGNIPGENLAGH